jgi:hypothetical protein
MKNPLFTNKVIHMKNKMRLMLFAVVSLSFAFVTYDFPGWDELIRLSPEIVIVSCKHSPESSRLIDGKENPNPMLVGRMGGVTLTDVEVVSRLKGTTAEIGSTLTLFSQYRPDQGDFYLLFVTEFQGTNCFALDNYRVVPLGYSFKTNLLQGKDLEQQVQFMIQYRLDHLNQELEKGRQEKERLSQAVKTVK